MTETNKIICQKIKKLREEIGISQQDLADRLGVLRPTISQIENGARKINADELLKLSKIFNVSVENLLGFGKEPEVILHEGGEEKKMKAEIRINVPQKNLKKFKLAYNFFIGFKRLSCPESWVKQTIATFRWKMVQVAGRIVRHAGETVLKLMIDLKKLDLFKGIREKSFELSLCPDG